MMCYLLPVPINSISINTAHPEFEALSFVLMPVPFCQVFCLKEFQIMMCYSLLVPINSISINTVHPEFKAQPSVLMPGTILSGILPKRVCDNDVLFTSSSDKFNFDKSSASVI